MWDRTRRVYWHKLVFDFSRGPFYFYLLFFINNIKVVPFLILAIGVDNLFIISTAFKR